MIKICINILHCDVRELNKAKLDAFENMLEPIINSKKICKTTWLQSSSELVLTITAITEWDDGK